MWFMNGERTELINIDHVKRFVVVKKSDTVLIVASYTETHYVTVARYTTADEAYEALAGIRNAVISNTNGYYIDGSTGNEEPYKSKAGYHGKKIKNHGGS